MKAKKKKKSHQIWLHCHFTTSTHAHGGWWGHIKTTSPLRICDCVGRLEGMGGGGGYLLSLPFSLFAQYKGESFTTLRQCAQTRAKSHACVFFLFFFCLFLGGGGGGGGSRKYRYTFISSVLFNCAFKKVHKFLPLNHRFNSIRLYWASKPTLPCLIIS